VDKKPTTGDKWIKCNKLLTNGIRFFLDTVWTGRGGLANMLIALAACGQASPRLYNQRRERMPTRGERVITEERVQDQLRNVIDPEIGMDLVELGLIYDVGVHDEGRHVDVTFSLTSPMCPVGDLIQEQVETETLSIEGVETVNAQLTFDPMWSPEMMSPAAKLFFGR
jgi:metal-sulfur cluster biosynthetic enzyme